MIFRLLFDEKLGEELNQTARARHSEKLSTISDYPHRARRAWEARPEHVGLARYAAFRLLHQEFAGSGIPGLPLLTGTGRRIARSVPWVRKVLQRGRS